MPSRSQRAQQNAARAASALTYKKRRLDASVPVLPNLSQGDLDDRLSTPNTSDTKGDTKGESGTLFWNKSADGNRSDTAEDGYSDTHKPDQEVERSRAEPVASPKNFSAVLKWNKEGEQKMRGSYGKGSTSSLRRQKISAQDLAKEASKSYNIGALWQRNRDLGMVSSAGTQEQPSQPSEPAC